MTATWADVLAFVSADCTRESESPPRFSGLARTMGNYPPGIRQRMPGMLAFEVHTRV